MGLRELAETSTSKAQHAVDKLLDDLNKPQRAECEECLRDLGLKSGPLAKAILSEYGFVVSAERIRDWRRSNVTEG